MNRIYRSRRDRVLLGVCGGIAHYFRVDPVVVRVLWVILALTPFPGIIAYLVAALLIPEEPAPGRPDVAPEHNAYEPEVSRQRTITIIGIGLVVVGILFLLRNWVLVLGVDRWLWRLPWLNWRFWAGLATSWWPLVIIAVGVAVLLGAFRRRDLPPPGDGR